MYSPTAGEGFFIRSLAAKDFIARAESGELSSITATALETIHFAMILRLRGFAAAHCGKPMAYRYWLASPQRLRR
jgi:hypothetical protein